MQTLKKPIKVVATAVLITSLSAQAQDSEQPTAAQAAELVADFEYKPSVIVTAPPAATYMANQADAQLAKKKASSTTSGETNASLDLLMKQVTGSEASLKAGPDVPWVMESGEHVWLIQLYPANEPYIIHLTYPSERSLRMVLPGDARAMVERSRTSATKYTNDVLGVALSDRSRQLETIQAWRNHAESVASAFDKSNPWKLYQFSKSLHDGSELALNILRKQRKSNVEQFKQLIEREIPKITNVMNSSEDYNIQLQWYGLMEDLQQGYNHYKTGVERKDDELIKTITDILERYPRLAPPAGPLPLTHEELELQKKRKAQAEISIPTLSQKANTPQKQYEAANVDLNETESSGGGLLAAAMILLTGFGVVGLFKRKKSSKA